MKTQPNTFRLLRALCRTMRKGDSWHFRGALLRHGNHVGYTFQHQCPFTFLGGKSGADVMVAHRIARKFGFDHQLTVEIIRAADSDCLDGKYLKQLRRILVRAVNLTEL